MDKSFGAVVGIAMTSFIEDHAEEDHATVYLCDCVSVSGLGPSLRRSKVSVKAEGNGQSLKGEEHGSHFCRASPFSRKTEFEVERATYER